MYIYYGKILTLQLTYIEDHFIVNFIICPLIT